jgi:hypothetical protein
MDTLLSHPKYTRDGSFALTSLFISLVVDVCTNSLLAIESELAAYSGQRYLMSDGGGEGISGNVDHLVPAEKGDFDDTLARARIKEIDGLLASLGGLLNALEDGEADGNTVNQSDDGASHDYINDAEASTATLETAEPLDPKVLEDLLKQCAEEEARFNGSYAASVRSCGWDEVLPLDDTEVHRNAEADVAAHTTVRDGATILSAVVGDGSDFSPGESDAKDPGTSTFATQ